jgi:putative ABC transport system substrate-binding protein
MGSYPNQTNVGWRVSAMGRQMRRREFISVLGGAAASWPLAAYAQQPAMPVIGFLYSQSRDAIADRLRGFHRGLKEAGFSEGENVAIEYRWGEGHFDRLPALTAELIRRNVALIAAQGNPAAEAVKATTTTTPIVFVVNADPVALGLVSSLPRPGGNATGVNFFSGELVAKRLELLHELVPAAKRVAVLVNPANVKNTEITLGDTEAAARAIGLQLQIVRASNSRELDAAFATAARERADALFAGSDGMFVNRRVQLANLASRYTLPATFHSREIVEAGGLMSYGADIADAFRQAGVYAGRIIKGAKPADLPVVQSSKFELVINHQTARMLGLTVPPSLLATADEVIE